MHASTILYGLVFLQGAMATPVGAAGSGIEPRGGKPQALEARAIEPRVPALGDIPFPLFPTKKPKKSGGSDCSTGGGDQQDIVCSSGTPFCCSPDGNGGQLCESTNSCNSKVICCNNNNGYQICMGDVNFNMPITININMKKKKE
ncbi:hypothetical protein NW759_011191 [Fusarium solani]|nr:hypothetical protein NW759_011191 [Fusarium solani]